MGPWGFKVYGVSKSRTRLSDLAHVLKLAAVLGGCSKYVPILQMYKLRLEELAECKLSDVLFQLHFASQLEGILLKLFLFIYFWFRCVFIAV